MTAETVRHETGIQWTWVPGYIGATWNPTTGCTRVSPGCDHCYAFQLHDQRHLANKRAAEEAGYTRQTVGDQYVKVARWSGIGLPMPAQYDVPFSKVQLLDDARLTAPLRARKPRAYFVDSMADLFHEDVPDEFLDRVFAVMALSPQHIFMVLTKRPERMKAYFENASTLDWATSWPNATNGLAIKANFAGIPLTLPNVWLGVSVEDQARADERIPLLLDTPAAVRFLSCEPLLGPVVLTNLDCWRSADGLDGESWEQEPVRPGHMNGLHWVIAGGESGPHARPMDLAWARSLLEQCRAAGVPFFMKQLGRSPLSMSDPLRIRNPHGSNPDEWPEDLRVRQFPEVRS